MNFNLLPLIPFLLSRFAFEIYYEKEIKHLLI